MLLENLARKIRCLSSESIREFITVKFNEYVFLDWGLNKAKRTESREEQLGSLQIAILWTSNVAIRASAGAPHARSSPRFIARAPKAAITSVQPSASLAGVLLHARVKLLAKIWIAPVVLATTNIAYTCHVIKTKGTSI